STVSPMWSPWPCVSRIASASTSSAFAAAFGFPVRNGSMSTVVPSCERAKAAWPRYRMSMSVLLLVVMSHELARKLETDRGADEHAQPRLLRNQGADGEQALLGVGLAGGAGQLRLVRARKPTAVLERLVEHALQRRS